MAAYQSPVYNQTAQSRTARNHAVQGYAAGGTTAPDDAASYGVPPYDAAPDDVAPDDVAPYDVVPYDVVRDKNPVSLTARIVAAYLGNNRVDMAGLPSLIKSVYSALTAADPVDARTGRFQADDFPIDDDPHVRMGKFQTDDLRGGRVEVKSGVPLHRAQPSRQATAKEIRESIGEDYIVCLEDGVRMTMLKRYIAKRYHLTPDQYRQKWGLPADYPMVAPAYSVRRSTLAKQNGLGRKPGFKVRRTAGAKHQRGQYRTA